MNIYLQSFRSNCTSTLFIKEHPIICIYAPGFMHIIYIYTCSNPALRQNIKSYDLSMRLITTNTRFLKKNGLMCILLF